MASNQGLKHFEVAPITFNKIFERSDMIESLRDCITNTKSAICSVVYRQGMRCSFEEVELRRSMRIVAAALSVILFSLPLPMILLLVLRRSTVALGTIAVTRL